MTIDFIKMERLMEEIKAMYLKDLQHRLSKENLTQEEILYLNKRYIKYWTDFIELNFQK